MNFLPNRTFGSVKHNICSRLSLFEPVITPGSIAKVHFSRTGCQFFNSILEEKNIREELELNPGVLA